MATKKTTITQLNDFLGRPTHIGDRVVFIYRRYKDEPIRLEWGVVCGFTNKFGHECVVIEAEPNLCCRTSNFYKIPEGVDYSKWLGE